MSDNVSRDKEYLKWCDSFFNSFRSINNISKELNKMKISTSIWKVFNAVDKLINELLGMEDDFKLNSKAELVQSLETLKAAVPTAMDLHEQMSKKADELTIKCDQWIRKMIKDGTKNISTSDFKSFLQTLGEISKACEPYFECIKQLQNQLTEVKDVLDKFFAEMQQEMEKKEEEFKKNEAVAYEAACRKKLNEEKRLHNMRESMRALAGGFGFLAAAFTGLGLIAAVEGDTADMAVCFGVATVGAVMGAAYYKESEAMSSADFMSEVIDKVNSEYNAVVKTWQQQIDRLEMQMEVFRCHFNELNELLDKCEANSQFNETTQKIMHSVINEIKHEIQRREEEQRKDEENRALKEENRLKDEELRLKDEENRTKDEKNRELKEKNRLKDEVILRLRAELAAKQQ